MFGLNACHQRVGRQKEGRKSTRKVAVGGATADADADHEVLSCAFVCVRLTPMPSRGMLMLRASCCLLPATGWRLVRIVAAISINTALRAVNAQQRRGCANTNLCTPSSPPPSEKTARPHHRLCSSFLASVCWTTRFETFLHHTYINKSASHPPSRTPVPTFGAPPFFSCPHRRV